MTIEKFTEKDIKEAVELAYPVWGLEHSQNGGKEFGMLMCEYIIRYGWYGEKYALKVVENGKMLGCILAGNIKQKINYNEWLDTMLPSLTESQKKEALALRSYFVHTSPKVHQYMNPDEDLYLSFFISSAKGCGKILLNEMIKITSADSYKNMYLWTDSSCNHEYYAHNKFILVSEFKNREWDASNDSYLTYIYKKSI